MLVLRLITKLFCQRKHNREKNLCRLSLLLRLLLYNRLRVNFLGFYINHRSNTNIHFRSCFNSLSFRQSFLISGLFLLLIDCFSIRIFNQGTKDGLIHRTCFNHINRRNVTSATGSCTILSALFLNNEGIDTIHIFVNITEHILNLHFIDCGNHIDTFIHLLTPVAHHILTRSKVSGGTNCIIHLLVLNLMDTLRYAANHIQRFIAGGASLLNLFTEILTGGIKFILKVLHTIKQSVKSYINEFFAQCSIHLRSSQNRITTHQRFHNVPAETHERICFRLT